MIRIPADAFKAVQKAQSKEKTRYYLRGVYVESQKLTATNGKILLTYDLEGDILGNVEPFILQIDPTEKALKKADYMLVDLERKIVETYNEFDKRIGVCACVIVDGQFPDHKRIIPNNDGVITHSYFAFDCDLMKIFGEAAKVFGRTPVLKLVPGESASSPALVYFGASPNLTGVIMPLRFT